MADTRKPMNNRAKNHKSKESARKFHQLNDADYEEIFSSVLAANTCNAEPERICLDVDLGQQIEDDTQNTRKPSMAKRENNRKSKKPARHFHRLSNADYEDIFSSVIAANTCDAESECGDIDVGPRREKVNKKKRIKSLPDLDCKAAPDSLIRLQLEFEKYKKENSPWECPVCFLPKSDAILPIAIPCGHVFCRTCIYQVANLTAMPKCPMCQVGFTSNQLITLFLN